MKTTNGLASSRNFSVLKSGLIALTFVLTFRLLMLVPLGPVHSISNTGFTVLLALFYLGYLLMAIARGKVLFLDLILIWIFIYALLAAFQSQRIFGQPLVYGILSQRALVLGISGILIAWLLKRQVISLSDVEKGFLVMAMLFFTMCLYFFLFVDPLRFLDETTFVRYTSLKGFVFFFNDIPIVMLLFYSLLKVKDERKWIYLPLTILICFFLIYFVQRRVMLVSIALCLLVFFAGLWKTRRRVFYQILAGGGIVFLVVLLLYPQVYKKYTVLLQETIVTLIRGHSQDPSMSARMKEIQSVLPTMKRHWILGTGGVSHRWREGYPRLFNYFYPEDLGFLGMLFVYGLLGTAIHYLIFLGGYRYGRAIRSGLNPFLSACRYGLLYLFFSSFLDANILRGTGALFILTAILYYASEHPACDSRNSGAEVADQ